MPLKTGTVCLLSNILEWLENGDYIYIYIYKPGGIVL